LGIPLCNLVNGYQMSNKPAAHPITLASIGYTDYEHDATDYMHG
jgi:hypothetical protein